MSNARMSEYGKGYRDGLAGRDEVEARQFALSQANQPGLNTDTVTTRAKAFLEFLTTKPSEGPKVIEYTGARVIIQGPDGPEVYNRQAPLTGEEL